MELQHPLRLVGYDERPLPKRVLGRHASRAAIGVTAERLDAAERKHEAPGGVAPVGTERHRACDIEGRYDPARCPQANRIP